MLKITLPYGKQLKKNIVVGPVQRGRPYIYKFLKIKNMKSR